MKSEERSLGRVSKKESLAIKGHSKTLHVIERIQSTSEEKQDAELQTQLRVDVTLSRGGAGRSEADQDRDDQISNAHSGYLRDQEPPGMLGHPQAHGQADDQIQDQQEQVGQPPERNRKKT